MKIKTSEATPNQINYLVAKCDGQDVVIDYGEVCVFKTVEFVEHKFLWKPSTNWAQGGPIIEREGMDLNPHGVDSRNGRTHWRAAIQWLDESDFEGIGSTPLIAAMRCYVASKLGDEVEIPEELK